MNVPEIHFGNLRKLLIIKGLRRRARPAPQVVDLQGLTEVKPKKGNRSEECRKRA